MAVLNNIFVNREYSADVELLNVGGGLCRVIVKASGDYANEVAAVQACMNAPGRVWRISGVGNSIDALVRYPDDGRAYKGGDENNPTITVAAVYFSTHSGENILLSLRMTPNARDAWQPPASQLPIVDAYPSGTSNLLARQFPDRQAVGIFLKRRAGHDIRPITEEMEFYGTKGNADFMRYFFVFCVAANSDVSDRLGVEYLYNIENPGDTHVVLSETTAVGAAAFGDGVNIGGRKNAQYYHFYAFEVSDIATRGAPVCVRLAPPGGKTLPGKTEAGAYGLFVHAPDGGRPTTEWLRRVVNNMYTGDVSPWACAQQGRKYPQIRMYAETNVGVEPSTRAWGPQIYPSHAQYLNATAGLNCSGDRGLLRMPTALRTESIFFGPWLLNSRRGTDSLCASVAERFDYDYIATEKGGLATRAPVVYVKAGDSVTVDIVTITHTPLFFHDGGTSVSIPNTQKFELTEATINGKAFGTQRFSVRYKSYDKISTITNNGTETATVVVAVCTSSMCPFKSPRSPVTIPVQRLPTVDPCMFGALRFLHQDKCVDLPVYEVDEFCEFKEGAAASWADGPENGAGLVRGWRAKSPAIPAIYADVIASAEVGGTVSLIRGRDYVPTDKVIIRSLTITREANGFVVDVEIEEAEVL